MAMSRVHLLLIDPQNDFCDLPSALCPAGLAPALPVPGAHQDMLRVAALIHRLGRLLTDITITLDTHPRLTLAHPGFWVHADGTAVAPFTAISSQDLVVGRVLPRLPQAYQRALDYLTTLEQGQRYRHMIWPVHCEIGSWGHAVHPAVHAACAQWQEQNLTTIEWVHKGLNPWTEHFSAIRAEVPDWQDPATDTNQALLQRLQQADHLLIAGEAGSHCVKATVEHLLAACSVQQRQRITLLTDCLSPVSGFAQQQQDLLAAARTQGVQLVSSQSLVEDYSHV